MHMEPDLQGQVKVGGRVEQTCLFEYKTREKKAPQGPACAEQLELAGEVSWPELPQHGLCQ